MSALLVAITLVASTGFFGLAAVLVTLARRAPGPRWAVRLAWLLAIQMTLVGSALFAILAHASFVYARLLR